MSKKISIFILFLSFASILSAQDKKVSLEEIWTGTFRQDRMQSLQSLKNGKEYVVKNYDRNKQQLTVDIYSYETGEKTGTLINTAEIDGLNYFSGFELSSNEDKALLGTEMEAIYRRSSKGIYYVHNLKTKSLEKVSDEKIKEPTFSPDASKVAYVFENNIYIKDLSSGKTTQVTHDGVPHKIINGTTDWVYEEEFAFVRAYEWNKTGEKIAFLRFDESEVPTFSMDIYGRYGEQLYPSQEVIKYPKAGEKNSEVSLHIYDLSTEKSAKVNLPEEYEYIPRIKWTNDPAILSAQTMNRHQDDLNLVFVNAVENTAKVVLHETAEAYIDVTDNLSFLNDNSFIWTSEKNGWNHIYHYDKTGKLLNQVTDGAWRVTDFYGFDAKTGRIYYQSTENGSINRDVFSIKANGKNKVQLTQRIGTNSADFSADFTYFINTFTNSKTPYVYTLHLAKNGKLVRKIKDNSALLEKLKPYHFSEKEFSTISVNGNDLNMWMIKPADFDPTKKYPLLMYQYSGPGSQEVSNRFFGANDYWYQLLAEEGYIVACVDGRGTGMKGVAFKTVTQNELGNYELEDQVAAAKLLGSRDYIDENRIGIWGWSYGGFMASNAIFQAPETYAMAIAVAPVTSWRFYDSVYTERYMETPQENPEGYDQNSPITHVDGLEDPFLLIHGTGDDNVHVQNSMQLISALIAAGKQFDMFLYPDRNHGIYGGNTRIHLYTMMTDFIRENL
ncbi:MAG TPA: S9 family peptidase [Flavobacteriaceae bacterium]|nr:S9 family peptidase [Flavobacteriaceae bacterium]